MKIELEDNIKSKSKAGRSIYKKDEVRLVYDSLFCYN